ncbi:LuxR C-terminal-related transcriptional regulator [Sorangium sp. So ce315]|uniref:helix-turn-helix transcriptional regulator n=1 Tax=Sorangium sp. So ce315 TaxID=3133299 RepID=UPI003F5F9AAA
MAKGSSLGGRDLRKMLEVSTSLVAARDVNDLLGDTFSLLLPLVGADCAALATTSLERGAKLDWVEKGLPEAFFRAYERMESSDFVLTAVQSSPGVVLRDDQMIDRKALQRNALYQWSRELGAPIEQVMAVMLPVGAGFQSGLSLYRARRRPFSLRDQVVLQELTRPISLAVRNCWSSKTAARWPKVLDALLQGGTHAIVLVRSSGRELDRTAGAAGLLDRWFDPAERVAGSLPRPLLEELARAQAARRGGAEGARSWKRPRSGASLRVNFLVLSEPMGESCWVLVLREVPDVLPVPKALAEKLTERERAVASRAGCGWDDKLIADDLGNAPATVKKQLRSIYEKLGVCDRRKLMLLLRDAWLDV